MKNEVRKAAFTLIELLVVVAIIVVLIAILVPALNKALYVATLTECAGNMDGNGTALITYAHGNRDSFPYRETQTSELDFVAVGLDYFAFQNALMFSADEAVDASGEQSVFDDRPLISTIIDYNKAFQDPFTSEISLNHADTLQMTDSNGNPQGAHQGVDDLVLSSNDLFWWFGFNGEGRLQKLDTRMTWTAPAGHPNAGRLYKWDILMQDRDAVSRIDFEFGGLLSTEGITDIQFSSHPDHDGDMEEIFWNPIDDTGGNSGKFIWYTSYMARPGPRTGEIDRNFLHMDGSVDQMKNVKSGPGMIPTATAGSTNDTPDERCVVIPGRDDGALTTFKQLMPIR